MSENNLTISADQKRMLAFAFLADVASGETTLFKETSEEIAKLRINSAFRNSIIKPYLDATYKKSDPTSKPKAWTCNNVWMLVNRGEARNTTIACTNHDRTELVIGVAGTNFINRYDWFVEDFEVKTQVAWTNNIVEKNNRTATGSNGYISLGTAIALQNTWAIKGLHLPFVPGKTLVEWLKDYLNKNENANIKTVNVTGHSLGGGLAPVLAQALKDHQNLWADGRFIQINTYSYAGPAIADAGFVAHLKSSGITMKSIYNSNDVVPNSWQINMIEKLPRLFQSYFGAPASNENNGAIVNQAIRWALAQSKGAMHSYERWGADVEEAFNGTIPPEHKGKIVHAANKLRGAIEYELESFYTKLRDKLIHFFKTNTMDGLRPYLQYFCEFLVILKGEHISQYYVNVFQDNDFGNELKKYIGGKSPIDVTGGAVLMELFKDIISIPPEAQAS